MRNQSHEDKLGERLKEVSSIPEDEGLNSVVVGMISKDKCFE